MCLSKKQINVSQAIIVMICIIIAAFASYKQFGDTIATWILAISSIFVGIIALYLSLETGRNVNSIMNALFLLILGDIENRNLRLKNIVRGNESIRKKNLTCLLWEDRVDMNNLLGVIESYKIKPDNLRILTKRYDNLLKRIIDNKFQKYLQFEGLKHLLWMMEFMLTNIPKNIEEKEKTKKSVKKSKDNIENSKKQIKNILNFKKPIPIDEKTTKHLQELIKEKIRWNDYDSKELELKCLMRE